MADDGGLNPARLSLDDAVRLLHADRTWLEADIAAGAPTNADGTINLVHYAAWLNKVGQDELASGASADE